MEALKWNGWLMGMRDKIAEREQEGGGQAAGVGKHRAHRGLE